MSLFISISNLRRNPVVKSLSVYTFIGFFSKGVSFLLIPLFTNPRYLTPSDNGMLSLFSSSMLFLAPFISLGMTQSASVDYFKKSKNDFSQSFTTNFFIAGIMAVLAIVILFFCKELLQVKYGFPPSFIFILPFIALLTFSNDQLATLVRNRNQVKLFAAIGLSKTLLEYLLAVVFVVFFMVGWQGRVWGIIISLVAANIYAVYYFFKNGYIQLVFKKHQLWDEIKFALPILIFQLCVFAISSSDKLILGAFNVEKHAIGIYSIAYLFGSLIGTVAQSVLLYFQPVLYKRISEGEPGRPFIRKDFIQYCKILTVSSVLIILGTLFLYRFVINKVYSEGILYFFICAATSYIWGVFYYLFIFLLYHKEKRKILAISILSFVLTITANVLLIKHFLVLGAALGGLIGVILFAVITSLFIKKTIKNIFAS